MSRVENSGRAAGLRFAVVVARFNDFVTDRLRDGAIEALRAAGVADNACTVFAVPGSFELPQAARQAAATGRFDAIVCLGCLVRGVTPHFEFISAAVAHGLTSAALATGVPMTFGVLTTNSVEEALERAGSGPSNKGWEAAEAALDLAVLFRRIAAGARDGQ